MKQKPIEFNLLSLFFLIIASSLPLQVMIQYHHLPSEVDAIFAKLTPLNFLIMFLSLVCSVLSFSVSKKLSYIFPILCLIVIWNNILFTLVDANFSPTIATLASIGFLAFGTLLFRNRPLNALKNPELHWWNTPKRKAMKIQTFVYPVTGGDIISETLNVSTTGAFILSEPLIWKTPSGTTIPNIIKQGTRCKVRMVLNDTESIACSAEIVRKVDHSSQTEHPLGFALQFIGLSNQDRNRLSESLETYPDYETQPMDSTSHSTLLAA